MAPQVIERRKRRYGDGETRRKGFGRRLFHRVSVSARLRVFPLLVIPSLLLASIGFLANFFGATSRAQTRHQRSGAHSIKTRESFTPSDRLLVERAIRIRSSLARSFWPACIPTRAWSAFWDTS